MKMELNLAKNIRSLMVVDHNEHGSVARKAVGIVLCCTAHLLIGSIAPVALTYLPLALLLTLYVVPLAYPGAWMHRTQLLRRMPDVLPISHIRLLGVYKLVMLCISEPGTMTRTSPFRAAMQSLGIVRA